REALDDLLGQRTYLAALHQAALDQALTEGSEQSVVHQAHLRHRTMAEALGGDEGQAQPAPRIRVQIGYRCGIQADPLTLATRQAGFAAEQGEQLVLAIARHPGDTD